MTIHQHTDNKKKVRNEFLPIYGITLVAAFIFMSAFQFLVKGEGCPTTASVNNLPLSADAPNQVMEDVFPIRLLKIFVNQNSF